MNTDELIEHVTNDMIAAIENGADTWQMPWHTIATNAQPHSIDDRPYRGLNAVVLALTAAANGWPSGTWATYRGITVEVAPRRTPCREGALGVGQIDLDVVHRRASMVGR